MQHCSNKETTEFANEQRQFYMAFNYCFPCLIGLDRHKVTNY